jgi:hypothetical protein
VPVQWESPRVLDSGRTDLREAVLARRLEALPPRQGLALAGLGLILLVIAGQGRDTQVHARRSEAEDDEALTGPRVRALHEVQRLRHSHGL